MNQPFTGAPTVPIGAPDVNINRPFTIWSLPELYTGPNGTGKFVPNPDDLVVDYKLRQFRRVTQVNYSTYEYTMETWAPADTDNSGSEVGGFGTPTTDSFRVLVNPSKHPMTLHVDARLSFKGSTNDSVRIFRGTDITDTGDVISAYVRNGELVGDTIPLELAAIDNVNNITIKNVVPGSCKKEVANGELVTIVVYGDTNNVTVIARAYVILTNMVMALEKPSRVIRDVRLSSPFMSPSDNKVLELPINIPLDDIPLFYEVVYQDGIEKKPLDNTRASLFGLRNAGTHDKYYLSTQAGHELDLVFTYKVGKYESYVGEGLEGDTIIRDYKATTLPVDGAYSVKLYVIPEWVDANRGYRLKYYLYSLERGNVFDATPYVKMGINSAPFNPTLYGITQHLVVSCDLSSISPLYNSHTHVQSFSLSLLTAGNEPEDNYLIEYCPSSEPYGEGLLAKFDYDNVTHSTLNLACNAADKEEWLERLYWRLCPLYDMRTEAKAPVPTHVEVVVGDSGYLIDVNNWMSDFNVNDAVHESQCVMLRWIQRTPNDELQLGMSPLQARQKV